MEPDEPTPLTPEELACVPVFPLPRLVFFPGTYLPLHLFEPRYRDMVEDCMSAGPRVMAVTMLEPNGEDTESPPMKPICSAGRIMAHERLPNGTHNVVLGGVCRVKLDELPAGDKRYRRARATPIVETGLEATHEQDRRALFASASSVVALVRRDHPEFELGVEPNTPEGRAADVIADRLISDAERRQAVLETFDVAQRVRLVTDAVADLLAMLASRDRRRAWVD